MKSASLRQRLRCGLVAMLSLFAALTLIAQTNSVVSTEAGKETVGPARNDSKPAPNTAALRHEQEVRTLCIEGRRLICGRILEVLPDGLIVECGYTNLLREPLSRSWLIPATAQASRAENLIESKSPGAICVGRVLLTDTPKSKRTKPARYGYVIVEGYPAGHYNHTSAVGVQRTVRKFSASLLAAVQGTLEGEK